MKLQSIRVAVLSSLLLASPAIGFAAGQHLVRAPKPSELQDRSDVTHAVQYGKGTGMTRNEHVLAGNAFRSQTAQDSQTLKDNYRASSLGDRALRK